MGVSCGCIAFSSITMTLNAGKTKLEHWLWEFVFVIVVSVFDEASMEFDLPNIRHLYALCEVARLGRISLAAEKVNMSQPAVTQAVAKMERLLDVSLFERQHDGMFASGAGEVFIRRVNRTLALLKEGEQAARRKASGASEQGRKGFHRLTTNVQLKALIAMSRTGNFSHAATQLQVSQPAVHRAARDLEKLSGMAFFQSTRRRIELTLAAETFAHHVRLANAEIRQGFFEVSEFMGRDSTKITIGSLPLARTSILPEAMSQLLNDTSRQVQMRCVDGPYESLLTGLRYGDLDFIIGALRDPEPAEDVVQQALFFDPLHVVASKSHPLAGRPHVTLEDTLAFPWIAPPQNTPTGSYLFEKLRIPQLADTPVRIVASSMVLVRGLMMRGDYLTIMSDDQAKVEVQSGLLTPLSVELPDSARPIGFTFRKGWEPTPTQNRFLNMIRAACDTGNRAKE